ncbi:MAG: type II toxin-antitoxin system VapC family toxin [Thermodesulfobacteriota bacterium]
MKVPAILNAWHYDAQVEIIQANERDVIGVSAISVWEIAELVEYKRLELPCPLKQWFDESLKYPGIRLIELTPEIAIESSELPGRLHRDPADQFIVATARTFDCPLITSDGRIQKYPYVKTVAWHESGQIPREGLRRSSWLVP